MTASWLRRTRAYLHVREGHRMLSKGGLNTLEGIGNPLEDLEVGRGELAVFGATVIGPTTLGPPLGRHPLALAVVGSGHQTSSRIAALVEEEASPAGVIRARYPARVARALVGQKERT